MLYLEKYLTKFLKLFLAEWGGGWLLSLKISSAQIFSFCNSNVTTFQKSRKCKNFNFFLLHCPRRNAISPEVFNEFSESFFCLKEEESGYCGWKFEGHRYFGSAIATLQLFQIPENVKISIFPFTLSQQKCYISRNIWRIFKNIFWLKEEKGGYCGLRISTAQTFFFQ